MKALFKAFFIFGYNSYKHASSDIFLNLYKGEVLKSENHLFVDILLENDFYCFNLYSYNNTKRLLCTQILHKNKNLANGIKVICFNFLKDILEVDNFRLCEDKSFKADIELVENYFTKK